MMTVKNYLIRDCRIKIAAAKDKASVALAVGDASGYADAIRTVAFYEADLAKLKKI